VAGEEERTRTPETPDYFADGGLYRCARSSEGRSRSIHTCRQHEQWQWKWRWPFMMMADCRAQSHPQCGQTMLQEWWACVAHRCTFEPLID
jgi:hypothetical protein